MDIFLLTESSSSFATISILSFSAQRSNPSYIATACVAPKFAALPRPSCGCAQLLRACPFALVLSPDSSAISRAAQNVVIVCASRSLERAYQNIVINSAIQPVFEQADELLERAQLERVQFPRRDGHVAASYLVCFKSPRLQVELSSRNVVA
jgi:hypothetical protein